MMGDFNPNVDPVSSHDTQIQGEISTKNPLPEILTYIHCAKPNLGLDFVKQRDSERKMFGSAFKTYLTRLFS